MRALAEGKIRWAYWPPGTDPATIAAHYGDAADAGIWIAPAGEHDGAEDMASDRESEYDANDGDPEEDEERPVRERAVQFEGILGGDSEEDEDSGDDAGVAVASTAGRFGALLVADEPGTDDSSEEA